MFCTRLWGRGRMISAGFYGVYAELGPATRVRPPSLAAMVTPPALFERGRLMELLLFSLGVGGRRGDAAQHANGGSDRNLRVLQRILRQVVERVGDGDVKHSRRDAVEFLISQLAQFV